MSEDDKEYVRCKINNEGFDYCFVSYSRFEEISDEKFHEIRMKYLDVIKEMENYLKPEEEK